jgi:hypothetical protein
MVQNLSPAGADRRKEIQRVFDYAQIVIASAARR